MKLLFAPAGERTKVLHIVSDSIPRTVRFTARRVSDGGTPEGTVEIVRRPWFVRKPPEIRPLAARQSFAKGFADVDYVLYVTPAEDVEIAFETRHFEARTLIFVLAALVVLAILSAVVIPLL